MQSQFGYKNQYTHNTKATKARTSTVRTQKEYIHNQFRRKKHPFLNTCNLYTVLHYMCTLNYTCIIIIIIIFIRSTLVLFIKKKTLISHPRHHRSSFRIFNKQINPFALLRHFHLSQNPIIMMHYLHFIMIPIFPITKMMHAIQNNTRLKVRWWERGERKKVKV